jgi:hypothetical protein
MLILHIPLPVASVYLAVYSATFRVSDVHQIKIVVRLRWEMCQKELNFI